MADIAVSQRTFHSAGDLGKTAIEVFAVVEIETSCMRAEHALTQTDGIGERPHDDPSAYAARVIQLDRCVEQMLDNQHSGQLIRMQTRLYISAELRPAAFEGVFQQAMRGPRRQRGQLGMFGR